MTQTVRSRDHRQTRRRRRRIWPWITLAVLVAIVGVAAWVGVRGYLAQDELKQAIPLASKLKSEVVSGDAGAAVATAATLQDHAREAAALTSDPVWRATELVPWAGPNLRVVRELSAAVDHVAENGVQPLTSLAGSIGLNTFKPVDGRIDVQPIVDAQPKLESAAAALATASEQAKAIDSTGTIQPLVDAHSQLVDMLDEARGAVDALNGAAKLVPAMLGSAGPRNYLVLFQNNAELRATGGIPGAMALVQTDGGALSLGQQTSAGSFGRFPEPVIELPTTTRGIYGENTARYMQDVNFTPNFPLSAQIAREMWNRRYGVEVDGVISLDPIALSYILEATGPITLPTGDVLDSGNAVKTLLQDVYARYPDPSAQDAFFAATASTIFERVAGGNVNPQALISSLSKASEERRVLVWSAHDEDQAVLKGSTLVGGLPTVDPGTDRFGVYFNDVTGSKMDPYLGVQLSTGRMVCRKDGLPNDVVEVTLTNNAPLDAATSLPEYVTGGGAQGVALGSIRTAVMLYGPPGSYNLGVERDGAESLYHPASDEGYPLSKLDVELAPGETTTLRFSFLGGQAENSAIDIVHTPLINPIETSELPIRCENDLK